MCSVFGGHQDAEQALFHMLPRSTQLKESCHPIGKLCIQRVEVLREPIEHPSRRHDVKEQGHRSAQHTLQHTSVSAHTDGCNNAGVHDHANTLDQSQPHQKHSAVSDPCPMTTRALFARILRPQSDHDICHCPARLGLQNQDEHKRKDRTTQRSAPLRCSLSEKGSLSPHTLRAPTTRSSATRRDTSQTSTPKTRSVRVRYM